MAYRQSKVAFVALVVFPTRKIWALRGTAWYPAFKWDDHEKSEKSLEKYLLNHIKPSLITTVKFYSKL